MMHKERHAASFEAYRSNALNYMGMHFPHLDHSDRAHQIPDFEDPVEKYASEFNPFYSNDYWTSLRTPLHRGCSVHHESTPHVIFDGYSSKRPERSYTWPPAEHPDSTYGSQLSGGTTPSMSSLSCLDSRTEISWTPDDCSSYTNGVTRSRQPRSKSIEGNKVRCDFCQWEGKTPSEKRKHEARHRKDHRCKEDGCDAKFGTRNDLERHRKSVHNKSPECGPKETYKCFGRGCGQSEKIWPRLDNFKAHLRLKHSEQDEEVLLSQSIAWYKKRKEEEEEVRKLSNIEGMDQPPGSGLDITARKVSPTNPTVAPSKTLMNSWNCNSNNYFDDKLEKLTLNPIGYPQSLRGNVLPENLQVLNELPYSPYKGEDSLIFDGDWKIPSVRHILADVTLMKPDDLAIRGDSETTPSKAILPGVDSFDQIAPSTEVLTLAAKLQNELRNLSQEERKICLKLATEEDLPGKKSVETTEKVNEMAKDGSQEVLRCSRCPKSFNRLSTLKKHEKRHDKPYGCTFVGCYGRFGSKADWKRHESMQHGHTQSFRCSLPRDTHAQCAKLFSHEKEFVIHLEAVHQADPGTIARQIATGRIGTNDAESRFTYWCGFCKEIKTVGKIGKDAQDARFDHIDIHFQKSENIKKWVPAKGHTEKGAQKKRDKNRKKECKRKATSRLEDNSGVLYDNGYSDENLSTYEECPSSADDTHIEAKPQPDSHGETKKARKVQHFVKGEVSVLYCCHCNGPQPIMAERCVECEHEYCSLCRLDSA